MELTRHQTKDRAGRSGHLLPQQFNLHVLLGLQQTLLELLKLLPTRRPAPQPSYPPIEPCGRFGPVA